MSTGPSFPSESVQTLFFNEAAEHTWKSAFHASKHKQLVSQASLVKDVACRISEQSETSAVQCSGQSENIDIHACETLLSGLWEALF